MNICSKCGEEKPRADFPKYGNPVTCKKCKNAKAREVYNSNLEENRAKKREADHRRYDTTKRREKARKWRKKYPEKLAANNRKTYEYRKAWFKSKPGYSAHYSSLYRKAVLQATPPWVKNDPEHLERIAEIYRQAKTMSEFHEEPYHVDHIHPINGKNVCGLHIYDNLQILPAAENIRKSNKLMFN